MSAGVAERPAPPPPPKPPEQPKPPTTPPAEAGAAAKPKNTEAAKPTEKHEGNEDKPANTSPEAKAEEREIVEDAQEAGEAAQKLGMPHETFQSALKLLSAVSGKEKLERDKADLQRKQRSGELKGAKLQKEAEKLFHDEKALERLKDQTTKEFARLKEDKSNPQGQALAYDFERHSLTLQHRELGREASGLVLQMDNPNNGWTPEQRKNVQDQLQQIKAQQDAIEGTQTKLKEERDKLRDKDGNELPDMVHEVARVVTGKELTEQADLENPIPVIDNKFKAILDNKQEREKFTKSMIESKIMTSKQVEKFFKYMDLEIADPELKKRLLKQGAMVGAGLLLMFLWKALQEGMAASAGGGGGRGH